VVEATTIDRETLDIFARTARGVLGRVDVDAGAALEEIGWRDFLAADAASVVPLVFGILGEGVIASSALDDVAFDVLGPRGEELRASGHGFAHPRGQRAAGSLTGTALVVDAVVFGAGRDAPVALVATAADAERLVTVEAGSPGLDVTPLEGIDPALGLARVRGSVATAEVTEHDEAGASAVRPACRRALAHELLGATDAMLAMATEYAKVRRQFGQPIGAFQAVKHRLADVYVARQAAAAVVEESWRSDPACTTVAAKALAAHAGALASENCLQVLGAIGFTLEHDLHRYVRRVRVLDRLYGSQRDLRTELGRLLQARGRVPRPGAA
jgi:alkylation response protein AidB-like acyl-CoA dehydrogenase